MDIYLDADENGTSTGFIKTKDIIILVYKDKIFPVPNTSEGQMKMENFLTAALREAKN